LNDLLLRSVFARSRNWMAFNGTISSHGPLPAYTRAVAKGFPFEQGEYRHTHARYT
jgi:hypothetical protein